MVMRQNLDKSRQKEMNILDTTKDHKNKTHEQVTLEFKAAAADLKRVIRARHMIRFSNYKGFYHSPEYDSFQRAAKCQDLT